MKPRWYQTEAADALLKSVLESSDNHPIAAVPTGAGKTIIMCLFIDAYLSLHPSNHILVLSHVKEILTQDHDALTDYFDGHTIGLWSSGLHSKDIRTITVAGIQSVWRCPDRFAHFDIVIIDECHLVTVRQSGMYREFLSNLSVNYVGLTATHFRLGHGYIHEGEGALFNLLPYDLSSTDNFNRLVDEGFLTNLIAKGTEMKMNTEGLAMRGGDFAVKGMSKRFDRETVTNLAVKELVKFGEKYKKWLIFAIDIKHAEHITEALNSHGIKAACVHSRMEQDRDEVIRDFKRDRYRAVVNVDILTTGFDVPSIDLIGMLRPTKSPVLHVQSLGRGLRVSPGKDHCLVLDFAGNTQRLGPINDVTVKKKEKGNGDGQPMAKECPDCKVLHHISVRVCDVCGHEFEFKTSLTEHSSDAEVVRRNQEPAWFSVKKVVCYRHSKNGKPDSVRVRYVLENMKLVDEWICLDHEGYAATAARRWVYQHSPDTDVMPETTGELLLAMKTGWMLTPTQIYFNPCQKYPRITRISFKPIENQDGSQ
jgi:DNA repair protein RadD